MHIPSGFPLLPTIPLRIKEENVFPSYIIWHRIEATTIEPKARALLILLCPHPSVSHPKPATDGEHYKQINVAR